MRPLERGPRPTRADDLGTDVPVAFTEYAEARPHLRRRVGPWCCYCGIRLNGSLAVEHLVAKSASPHLALEWSNLLLVCNNCNATKNDEVAYTIDLAAYVWPDTDRTYDLFEVRIDGRMRVRSTVVDADERQRAQATLDLCGLEVTEANLKPRQRRCVTDQRWLHRRSTWRMAEKQAARLSKAAPDGRRDDLAATILDCAEYAGCFDIWFTVFRDAPDIRLALVERFSGTCAERLWPAPA